MNMNTLFEQTTQLRRRANVLARACTADHEGKLIDEYNECMQMIAKIERFQTELEQLENQFDNRYMDPADPQAATSAYASAEHLNDVV